MTESLYELAETVGDCLWPKRQSVAVAESCTGGLIAKTLTDVPGSSRWFDRGFITYSDQSKIDMLGVTTTSLADYGAVSEAVALEMARGAIKHSGADISVAVTGIAGPGGGSDEKPVGLVWIAWSRTTGPSQVKRFDFAGDREQVRHQAAEAALKGILLLCQQ